MAVKRVLVVDDSKVVQQVLKAILESDPNLEVVGIADDPMHARELIKKLKPDVITLDVEMPKMDGVTFLKNLMRLHPLPVVMISTLTEAGAAITLDALEIGACDFVAKPQGNPAELEASAKIIISKVRSAAGVNMGVHERRLRQKREDSLILPMREKLRKSLAEAGSQLRREIVAIGASTGGTEAIKDVLRFLPSNCPPIVIVQHIPAGFSTSYAKRLDSLCELEVKEAESGDVLQFGHAYLAPGSHHMRVKKIGASFQCVLSDEAPVNKHRPAVDVLFESVKKTHGKNSTGIILTGMGSDGARELLALRETGAVTIGQNEETCVVWGMPRAASELGAVEHSTPLEKIAEVLIRVLSKKCGEKSKA